ncbi:MBL fold metallo-hydrolase [Niabella sp. CJ426]|jgi:L-ascorbate metabolism protein UlaG (beta-lactamase superfamily)|uniref:MBL fold metallo-hydrolase n=1 Tax=Niabella sp. CJ426 TaxID=3393740 RepID=UPI003CFBD15B
MFPERKLPAITSFINNPALKTVMDNWSGTPVDQSGRFINLDGPTVLSMGMILKHFVERNPQRDMKKKDTWRIPVLTDDNWLNDEADKIVWLGHASFFIQMAGLRMITDPVFGRLPMVERHSPLPVDPGKLVNIDYILVTHAHYDHCDKKSLQLLSANNPQAHILCGLNLDRLIGKWINNPVHTAGWYQQYDNTGGVKITFVPSRHWANRGLSDANTTLWGGFVMEKADGCIYFSGDSGYGSHYKAIGHLFPRIDVALLGAGAYAPAWFMGKNHQDPYQALQAFRDTGAQLFIPFHYGTFDMADEPMGETEQILNRLKAEGKINNELKILKLGEALPV